MSEQNTRLLEIASAIYDFTHKLLEVKGSDTQAFLNRMFIGFIGKAKVGEAKYTPC